METKILHVEGMACSHCEQTVKKALEALDGVRSAEASAKKKQAKVEFDPAKVTVAQMRGAVAEAGYEVKD